MDATTRAVQRRMIMLKPKVRASEFKKFGFKRCKGIPKESECYYLCIARGCKMLFVSDSYFGVNDWDKNDPRIHKSLKFFKLDFPMVKWEDSEPWLIEDLKKLEVVENYE